MFRRSRFLFIYLFISFCEAGSLPVPRFVSLKAATVNFHVGPGMDYPTEWQYIRKGLPVEVIAEFGHWRLVRDIKGNQGWVHRSLLSGNRTILITNEGVCTLHAGPDADADVLAQLEKDVICKIKKCQKDWCYVEVEKIKGWIQRPYIWGVYAHEVEF